MTDGSALMSIRKAWISTLGRSTGFLKSTVSWIETKKPKEDIVTLELDEAGDIIGPELAFNSSPPLAVNHPKAGVGLIEEEPSRREDGTFISYHFPEDPNVFVMPYCPQKGKKEP